MSIPLRSLEDEALKLSPEDRTLLVDHLLGSVYGGKDVDHAWAEEVRRRLVAVESGADVLVPVDDAIDRARRSLA